MSEEEIWKPVVGYEGYYEVSSLGRVRSLRRTMTRKNGIPHTIPGRVLKQPVSKRGYFTVALHQGGVQRTSTVHRIIAKAFIPNPDNLPVVRHLNDNPLDNRIENLAWGTQRENTNDAIRNGTHRSWPGEKTHCAHGHEFTEENTYRDPRNRRRCRTCRSKGQKGVKGGVTKTESSQ